MFKRNDSTDRLESELAALTARVEPLRRRIEEARAAHAQAVDARAELIGKGDFTTSALDEADAAVEDATRRLRGFEDAGATLAHQIAAVEARLAGTKERAERERLARGLDETLDRTETAIRDLYNALRVFAEYLDNLPPSGPLAAVAAMQFRRSIDPLIADALAEGRAYVAGLRDGTQPLPPPKQQAAA